MNTTLNQILKYSPCKSSWVTLLRALNKTKADDELLTFKFILESSGIENAVWCLRVLDFRSWCLFCADVAELVLPIFEKHYPTNGLPRETIEAIRAFHRGEISEKCLRRASRETYNFYATVATDPYASAAYVAARASTVYPNSAFVVVHCAILACKGYSASKGEKEKAESDARKRVESIWKDIERLFIKHFIAAE